MFNYLSTQDKVTQWVIVFSFALGFFMLGYNVAMLVTAKMIGG